LQHFILITAYGYRRGLHITVPSQHNEKWGWGVK